MSQKEAKSSKCLGTVAPVDGVVAPLHNLSLKNVAVGVNVQPSEPSLSEAEKKSASLVFSTLLSSWKDFTSTEGTENQAGLSYKLHQLAGIDTNAVDRAVLNVRRKAFNQKALEVDGRNCSPMFSNEHLSLAQEEHSSYHVATAITSPMLGCMMHPKGKEFGMVGAAATAVENGWKRFQTTVDVISLITDADKNKQYVADYFKFFDMADNMMLVGKASMTCVPERDAVINAYDTTLRDVNSEDKDVRFGNRMRRVLANHMRVMHSVLQACTEDYKQSEDDEKRQIWAFLNAQCCAATDRNNVSKLAYDAMTAVVSDIVTQQTCKDYYEHVRKLFDPRPRDEKGDSSASLEVLRNSELMKMGNTPITKEEWGAWKKRLEGSQSEIMDTGTKLQLLSDWFEMLVRVASRSSIQGDALWYGTSCMNLHLFICMDNSACNWRCHSSTTSIDANNQQVAQKLSETLEGMEERVSKAFDSLDVQTKPLEEVTPKVENVEDSGDNSIDANGVINVAVHNNVYRSVKRAGAVTRSQTNTKAAWEARPHSIPSDGVIFLHPDDEEGETRNAEIVEAYQLIVLNSQRMAELYGDITVQITNAKKSYTELAKNLEEFKVAPKSEQARCSLESQNYLEEESKQPQAPCDIGTGYKRGAVSQGPRMTRAQAAQAQAASVHSALRNLHRTCRNAETCRADVKSSNRKVRDLLGESKSINERNPEFETDMQRLVESEQADDVKLRKLQENINNLEGESDKLKTLLQNDDEGDDDEDETLSSRLEKLKRGKKDTNRSASKSEDSMDSMEESLEQQATGQPPTLEELALTEFLNKAWRFTDPVDMATTLESLDTATREATISTQEVETAEQEKEKHAIKAQIVIMQAWSHVKTHSAETFNIWYTRLFEGSSSTVFAALHWLRHHVAETACKTVWKFAKKIVLSTADGLVTYASIKLLSETIAVLFNNAFGAVSNVTGSYGDWAAIGVGLVSLLVTALPGMFNPNKVNLIAVGSIITYKVFQSQFIGTILSTSLSYGSGAADYISGQIFWTATQADNLQFRKVATVLRILARVMTGFSWGTFATSWAARVGELTVAGLAKMGFGTASVLNDGYNNLMKGTRDGSIRGLDKLGPEMNPMSLVIQVVVVRNILPGLERCALGTVKCALGLGKVALGPGKVALAFLPNPAAMVPRIVPLTLDKTFKVLGMAIENVSEMGRASVGSIDDKLRGNVVYDHLASYIRYIYHLPWAITKEFGNRMVYKIVVQQVVPRVYDSFLFNVLPADVAAGLNGYVDFVKEYLGYGSFAKAQVVAAWATSLLDAAKTYVATLSPEAKAAAVATIATLFAISVSVAVIRNKKRERDRTDTLTLSDAPEEDDRTKMPRLQGPTQTLIESHIGGKEFALAVAFLEMAMVASA